ncbi:hypothetical protein [Rhizobium sp. Root149]|uniref:hypothetical protein n=1 Tax=Rhizobium sp. Root149 TaxID=1736473 RepID=UPI000A50CD6E|nr:hypothetical protein [Rhizobium sp. Root149]
MSKNLRPTVVKNTEWSLEQECKKADPDWIRDRNYLPAYEFKGREFIDHRDNVYQGDE